MVPFSRCLILATVLFGPAAASRAEDEAKKTADDSITANRKELEALRTEPSVAPAPEKLGLPPGLDMPAAATASGSPAPSPRPEAMEALATPAKSSGWLIEGMEKARSESGRDAGKNGEAGETGLRDRKDPENARLNPKGQLNAANDGSKAGERDSDRDRANLRDAKSGEKAPNPLSGYMSTWMTPGDFTLLQKPAAIDGSAFLTPLPDFTTQTAAGRAGNASSGTAGGTAIFAPGPAAPENPYLQALTGNSPPVSSPVTELGSHQMLEPGPMALPHLPAWLSPPAPEPFRMSPLLPENLKPSDDAKYFPQLKRF